MELSELIVTGLLYVLYGFGAILLVVLFSYIGVLVYDEFTSRSNDLYELLLSVAVGVEFLFRGRPKKEYRGRHHRDEVFISDLVKELRRYPLSLCYRGSH